MIHGVKSKYIEFFQPQLILFSLIMSYSSVHVLQLDSMSQLDAASSLLPPARVEGQLARTWKSADGKSLDEVIDLIHDRINNIMERGDNNHERLNDYKDFQLIAGIKLEKQEKNVKKVNESQEKNKSTKKLIDWLVVFGIVFCTLQTYRIYSKNDQDGKLQELDVEFLVIGLTLATVLLCLKCYVLFN